jgi:OFA family oxalate/formate antiporter-like MFS transporter
VTATEVAAAREEALDSAQGWLIVGLGICVLTTIWGAVFTFTVYADRLAATFASLRCRSRRSFRLRPHSSSSSAGSLACSPPGSPLRPVLATVGVGPAIAATLLQVVDSYVGVVVAFALLGTAGGTAFTIVVSLAPQWFDAYQGLATSITMTGVGLGTLVLPFVWLWLFDRTGLRTTFAVVIGVTAVVVLVSSLIYRRPPGRSQNATTADAVWLRARIGDTRFLCTAIGFALAFSWYYVLSSHLVEILTTGGIDVEIAQPG